VAIIQKTTVVFMIKNSCVDCITFHVLSFLHLLSGPPFHDP